MLPNATATAKGATAVGKRVTKAARRANKRRDTTLAARAATFETALTKAGIDLAREVTELEMTFMAPQLMKEPALLPDSVAPRAAVVMPVEIPIILGPGGRAAGVIMRDVRRVYAQDATTGVQTFTGPTFTARGFTNALWTAAPASTTDVWQLGTPCAASGVLTDLVGLGPSYTDNTGTEVPFRKYTITATGLSLPGLPVDATSSATPRIFTDDTTAARWNISAEWITDTAGVIALGAPVTSLGVTGSGTSVSATLAAPANAVALYRVIMTNTAATQAGTRLPVYNVTISTVDGAVYTPVGGASQFADLDTVADRVRITGLVFHLRNDSPEITAQGEVVAYQQRDDDVDMPTRTTTSLSAFRGRYAGKLADGMYGWMLPWSNMDGGAPFNIPWQDLNTDSASDSQVNDTDVVHWAVQVDPTATNQQLVMVIYPVVEYRTVFSFVETRTPRIDLMAMQDMYNLLANFPHIMANDSHWEQIKAFIGGSLKKVYEVLRPIIKDVAIPALSTALVAAL